MGTYDKITRRKEKEHLHLMEIQKDDMFHTSTYNALEQSFELKFIFFFKKTYWSKFCICIPPKHNISHIHTKIFNKEDKHPESMKLGNDTPEAKTNKQAERNTKLATGKEKKQNDFISVTNDINLLRQ